MIADISNVLARASSSSSGAAVFAVVILVLFIMAAVALLFTRYKKCPSDKILIVYGNVGAGRSAKCIHGGATFVWPLIQSHSFLDLNPLNIDVPLKGALSSQNIRVDVPSSFIVGISTQPEIMQNAASRLLGRTRQDIRDLASEIIMGQMRVVIASLTIEEINADREKLIKGITGGVDVELHKVGLYLINANITDIRDASGYIAALGQEAAARAINDAMIKVAEETRRGEIGKAEALRDQTVQVAMANAHSGIVGHTEQIGQRRQDIHTADRGLHLQIHLFQTAAPDDQRVLVPLEQVVLVNAVEFCQSVMGQTPGFSETVGIMVRCHHNDGIIGDAGLL